MKEKVFLLIAVIFWGWSFVFTKELLGYVTPAEVMGLRLIIALPILLSVVKIKKIRFEFEKKDLNRVLLGGLIIAIHFFIQITGVKYTTATNTGWIISITPLVMALLSFLILKERIGLKEISGIIVATIGILLLVSKGHLFTLDWLQSTGDWLVLISAHTWAIYTVLTRDISRKYNPLAVTTAILAFPALLMLIYMIIFSDWTNFVSLPPKPLLSLLALGILCMAIAHWFWQEGVAKIGATRAGIFLYLEPLATTALAIPFLSEKFGLFTGIGGGLVLCGVFIAERKRK